MIGDSFGVELMMTSARFKGLPSPLAKQLRRPFFLHKMISGEETLFRELRELGDMNEP